MKSPFCLLSVLPKNAVNFAVKKLNKSVLAYYECECNPHLSRTKIQKGQFLLPFFFIYPKIVGDEYSDECMMNVFLIGWKKISVSNYLIS